MSPRLTLNFLGPPQIHLDDKPLALDRRKMVALLAYLSIERGEHQRAHISSLLWPDYEQAKAYKNLRQTIWEIQKNVGEGWLLTSREKIGLNENTDIFLDIAEFESLLEKSKTESDVSLRTSLLADSAKLYRNHFLTGFSLKDAYSFNDWAYAESEQLRQKFSDALTTLSDDYCSLNEARQAIPYARRLISLDPLNEAAHRQLMNVYLQAGQNNAALKQYQSLEQILRKELNLDPQPETRNLYKKIRRGEVKPVVVEKPAQATASQHNLPLQLSSFIGREREKNDIKKLFQNNRLVTLLGTGGIGKTSLSLQVGQSTLHDFPDGVWFVGLDALSDPNLITQTMAAVFDIRESGDRPLLEKLTDVLRAKNALLIFDNCEHLLSACLQLVTAILSNCPNIKVLATSREELGILGEAIYTMPALPIPEQTVDAFDQLTEYESIKLFSERAALALTSFQLTKENIQTVVDICRKVDGIPLAIELAAARVNIMQVDEILNQLNESFALLAKSGQTIMPRHQTLWASMDWGWGLLSEAEQVFLQQLSVFAGGWTLESAQAICEGDVLSLTDALAKKSLIVVKQETGRETRYRFHEMVRQYMHEKFVGSGNVEEIRIRHLRYFLDISEKAELELRGKSHADWMERLDAERNNIRAALHWAEKTDVDAGLYIAGRLIRFWESLDQREGLYWCEHLLKEAQVHPHARATALHTYSWLLTWLQKFDDAYSAAQECLDLFISSEDKAGEADALVCLENIYQFKGDLATANTIGNKALTLSTAIQDQWREANALNYLGWGQSEPDVKFDYWNKAILLYRETGDQIHLANLIGLFGQFKVANGEIEIGEKYLDEALELWRLNKQGNVWENPKIAKSLISLINGRYEEAQSILEEVLLSSEQSGNRMAVLWAKARMGYVAFHAGNMMEAQQLLLEVARAFEKDDYVVGCIFALEGLAGLYATFGKLDRAARLVGFSDTTREKIGEFRYPIEQADVDISIAVCKARMGETDFDDAYKEGTMLTLKDAMELVLQQHE